MTVLLISWTTPDTLTLRLLAKGRTSQLVHSGSHLDTILLSCINDILKKNKVSLAKLDTIGVVKQDMSLASLRLLLSAVNSLAWARGLPVAWISQKQFENPKSINWPKKMMLLKPVYARPAVITSSKR